MQSLAAWTCAGSSRNGTSGVGGGCGHEAYAEVLREMSQSQVQGHGMSGT